MPVIDAPPTPAISLAPGGRYVALVHHEAHPPVAMLARPYLALAGIRVDPHLGARRRLRRARRPVGAAGVRRDRAGPGPAGRGPGGHADLGPGRAPARGHGRPADGVGLWVADAETGEVTEIAGLTVCDVLGGDPSAGRYLPLVPRRPVAPGAGRARAAPGARRAGPRAAARGDLGEALPARDLPGSAARPTPTRTAFEVLATSVPCRSTRPAASARNWARPGSTTG